MNIRLAKECTGCSACYAECHKDAIQMILNKDGFYQAIINKEQCVECGKCMKVCPVLHSYYENEIRPKTYAFMASDEIRSRSSSGGVFEVLASYILEHGGVVCGVAYEQSFLTHHIIIDKVEDIKKLRGSKYIMSNMGDVISEIFDFLKAGKDVLFTGTPCQVAGVKSFCRDKKFNGQLITVDLICHGIPSVKAFNNYLADLHSHHPIEYIGFKEKQYGWHASMTIDFVGADRYNAPCEKDTYFWSYLSGVNKNRACGNCQFAKIPRQGDITIGDYWGISKYDESMNDGKGTSVVLINNESGRKFWEKINNTEYKIREMTLESAIAGNKNLIQSPRIHISRNQFFKQLGGRRFDELARWCYGADRFDIGIVGIPVYVNFGGSLTYYALYKTLNDMGYSTLMIGRPRSSGRPPILPMHVYEKNPYPENALRLQFQNKEEMRILNNCVDTFVVGSDQLFNADLYYKFGEIVTLDWVNDNHKKIAYAASFGHSRFWGKEDQRALMSHYMRKFDAFSVREDDAVSVAKEYFGVDTEWVLDPIFLCDKKHYYSLSEQATNKYDEKHIYAYILDPSQELNDILNYFGENLSMPICLYSEMLFEPNDEKRSAEQRKFTHHLRHGMIEERLYNLIHSEYIITNSFHGVCLAIIFHIPFVAILNSNRGSTRFYSILSKLGLMDRLATNVKEAKDILYKPSIDFEKVDILLSELRSNSTNWLTNVISQESGKSYSSDDIFDAKMTMVNKDLFNKELKINCLISGHKLYKYTDVVKYLNRLRKRIADIQVFIAVKDTPGFSFNHEMDKAFHKLGLKESLVGKHWKGYVAIIDGGSIVFEKIGVNEERVAYEGVIGNTRVKLVSRPYRQGNVAVISVNGIDYSENQRGVNFVVINKLTGDVIDSVAFDTHDSALPCYRFGKLAGYGTTVPAEQTVTIGTEMSPEAKAEKRPVQTITQIANNTPISGVSEANTPLLHNLASISAMGGSAMDYYKDKGCQEIAIYGDDVLIGLINEQAYYSNIGVKYILSNQVRDIVVRFPRVGVLRTTIVDDHIDDIKDVHILVAAVNIPDSLIKIRQDGGTVEKLGEVNAYSHFKRILFDPLIQYKNKLKHLPCLVFNMPVATSIKNASDIERNMAINKDNRVIFEEVFKKNGMDQLYYQEVTAKIPIKKVGRFQFVDDINKQYVHASNGYRKTISSKMGFIRSIYAFGNSICYGLGADDDNTIPSVLQKCLNESKLAGTYSVLNCANSGGFNAKEMWDSIQYHLPQSGDIIIILASGIPDIVRDKYCTDFIWCDGHEILDRPHDLGEIYWDMNHVNAKGYKAIGEKLFNELNKNNAFLNKEQLKLLPHELPMTNANIPMSFEQEQKLIDYLDDVKKAVGHLNGTIGSIVMNCNPFTNGHRYLIEQAKEKCDCLIIFVVQEDKSFFRFEDRLRLVREGTKDIDGVYVVPSGEFIISQTTFSAYFAKENVQNVQFDSSEDVLMFATKIAPALGITIRFAGEEPLDIVTEQYNQNMMRILPKFGISFEVFARKESDDQPISASRVRKLLLDKDFDSIKDIVPVSTYNYLYTTYSNSKRVLVLGGTRFMGIRLVEKLINAKHFVTIANRGTRKDCFGKYVSRIQYDRKNEQSVREVFFDSKYDCVIDTSAYDSISTRYVLSYISCDRYIQVSSVAIYPKHHLNLLESECNTSVIEYKLEENSNYGVNKRNCECVALQEYISKKPVVVRIPFVVEPENLDNKELNLRLYFYVEKIMKGIPICVDNLDYCCAFVRTTEEADFLMYLMNSEYVGAVNFSSVGYVTVREIVRYIEKKTRKKAIITDNGEMHPFNAKHFGYSGYSFNLQAVKSIGYKPSKLKDWLWPLIDKYISLLQ